MTILSKFKFAFNGIKDCYKSGSSFRIMSWVGIAVVLLGLFCYFIQKPLSEFEWIILITFIFVILCIETLNTALEKCCDLFSGGWLLDEIRVIKDVAAGASLLLSLGSVIVGLIIFIPKLLQGVI
jgi:diacylglycerol kinase